MRTLKRSEWKITVLAITVLFNLPLVGCGGSVKEEGVALNGQNGQRSASGSDIHSGSGTSSADENFAPTHTYDFSLLGNLAEEKTEFVPEVGIPTDSIFKVKVSSNGADRITAPGHGFVAEYGCVKYTVTVLGESRTTQTLRVEGADNSLCQDAPTSEIFDFSDRLGGPLEVFPEVSDPHYDFYCKLWHQIYSTTYSYYQPWLGPYWADFYARDEANAYSSQTYCPMKRVTHDTHIIRGRLEIETNTATLGSF